MIPPVEPPDTTLHSLPPVVEILTPDSSSETLIDSVVEIDVKAIDPDGYVEYVDILVDDSLLAHIPINKFNTTWRPVQKDVGSHQIRAVAMDNTGERSEASASIVVRDFREDFYGNYSFTTVHYKYDFGLQLEETLYFHGTVRPMDSIDQHDDLAHGEQYVLYPDKCITIEFTEQWKLATPIKPDGYFDMSSYPWGYDHHVHFHHQDSLSISISSFDRFHVIGNIYHVEGHRE